MPNLNATTGFVIFPGTAGLTLVECQLSKAGAAPAVITPSVDPFGDGAYRVTPAAADRDTVGANFYLFEFDDGSFWPYQEQVTPELATAGNVSASTAALTALINLLPSAVQVASQTRVELATELGRLDEKVSAPKTLTSSQFAQLFADVDAPQFLSDMIAGVLALIDDGTDAAPQVFASVFLNVLKADPTWIEVQADTEASRAAAVAAGTAVNSLAIPTASQNADAVRLGLATELTLIGEIKTAVDSLTIGELTLDQETIDAIVAAAKQGFDESTLDPSNLPVGSVTRTEVYRLFGRENVRRWADLDAGGVEEDIDFNIDAAIATETEYVLGSVRKHVETSTALTSLVVRDVIARYAGLSIHDGRGYDDTSDGKPDPLQKHRKLAEARMREVAIGRWTDDLIKRRGSYVPGVVTDDDAV